MALSAKAGTFQAPATTGNQSVTGIGFAPKAVIWWTVGGLTSGTPRASLRGGAGFFTAATYGRVRDHDQDNVGTSNANHGTNGTTLYSAAPLTFAAYQATTPLAEFQSELVSLNADGWTANWTTVSGNQEIIHYLAIGGSDVMAYAGLASLSSSAVAGSVVRYGGVPFRPRALLFLPHILTVGAAPALGVAAQHGGQWCATNLAVDGAGTNNTQRRLDSDSCLVWITGALGIDAEAAVSAWNNDGFSLTVVDQAPSVVTFAYIALGGPIFAKAGAFAKPTSTSTPVAQTVSGVGVKGKAALFATTARTTLDTTAADARLGLGATDGTTEGASAYGSKDGGSPTVVNVVSNTSKAILKADNNTATVEAAADLVAFNQTSVGLSWTTNDAVATEIAYLVLGDDTHALQGASGGTSQTTGTLNATQQLAGASYGTSYGEATLGPFHPLAGTSAGTSLSAATLRLGHALSATSIGRSESLGPVVGGAVYGEAGYGEQGYGGHRETWHTDLRLGAKLVASSIGTSASSGVLGQPQDVAGASIGTSTHAANLRLGASLSSVSTGTSDATGWLALFLDNPMVAGDTDLVGTVNLVRNPSAEVNALDWFAEASATVSRDTGKAWDGVAGIYVTASGAFPNQGASVRSIAGIGWIGTERVIRGHVRAAREASNQTGMAAWVRVRYTDGSIVDGDKLTGITISATGLNGEWQTIHAPAFTVDAAKAVDYIDVVVVREVGAGGLTFRLDGAQIEEDQGEGPTPFAIGSYGSPYHRWVGPSHLSPTIREPIPTQTQAYGRGGARTISAKLYLSNHLNEWREDISDGVIAATVEMNPGRDVTWTLTATITKDLWATLRPFHDWVAPVLTITDSDGTVREGQLGLYVVLDSPEAWDEHNLTVQLEARDPLWLLMLQGFTGPLAVRAGIERMRVVREILDTAAIAEDDDGRRRYSIPDAEKEFKKDREWPRKTSKLTVINEIMVGSLMFPLYVTAKGVITTRHRGKARLRDRQPVRVWTANIPDGIEIDAKVLRKMPVSGEVVGTVTKLPADDDLSNEIVVVSGDPNLPRVHVKHKITHPNNPRAIFWGSSDHHAGRRRVREIHNRLLEEDADAQDLADILADELSSQNKRVEITTLPDPSIDYVRESVYLAIYTAKREPVAVGQYAVRAVRWGFGPGDCLQTMTLARIDDSSDLYEEVA